MQMANHDALTGLPNRALFSDRLARSIAQAKRNKSVVGLLYLDLSGFKTVNAVHGHQAGDELLIQFAEKTRNLLRESDTLARLGGDEFVIILQNIDGDKSCLSVSEKILSVVSEPFELSMAKVNISVSIGIACYPINVNEQDALIKAAYNAMNNAKKTDKNKVCVYQGGEYT